MVENISLIIVRTVSGFPEKRYVSTSLFFTSGILYTLYIESKNDIASLKFPFASNTSPMRKTIFFANSIGGF